MMRRAGSDNLLYFVGIMFSLILHLIGAVTAIALMEREEARALKASEIFTVTLEGGEVLGGISQVPDLEQKKKEIPPAVVDDKELTAKERKEAAPEPVPEKELTEPSVVEDPEKIEAEKKALEEALKKEEAARKKKLEEQRKKKEAEEKKRRKAEAEQKKKLEKEKKVREKKARDRRLKEAINKAAKRYSGESADAGGEGFGAAKLGGSGMGGGTLAGIEFITYHNELQRHIKSGWHWLPGEKVLSAQVLVSLASDGTILSARVVRSSGNEQFDNSVMRAVYKASPVPPPPAKLYMKFREVRITFDSDK